MAIRWDYDTLPGVIRGGWSEPCSLCKEFHDPKEHDKFWEDKFWEKERRKDGCNAAVHQDV